MYPGESEIPLIEQGKQVGMARPSLTGRRTPTRFAPTGMVEYKKGLLGVEAQDKALKSELAKERLAISYASQVADEFKDPEAFNQAYLQYKQKLDMLSGLMGLGGLGGGLQEGVEGGEAAGGEVGGEESIDAEVDVIMSLPPEDQSYVLENLGDDEYANAVRQRIMQMQQPVEEAPTPMGAGIRGGVEGAMRGMGAQRALPWGNIPTARMIEEAVRRRVGR